MLGWRLPCWTQCGIRGAAQITHTSKTAPGNAQSKRTSSGLHTYNGHSDEGRWLSDSGFGLNSASCPSWFFSGRDRRILDTRDCAIDFQGRRWRRWSIQLGPSSGADSLTTPSCRSFTARNRRRRRARLRRVLRSAQSASNPSRNKIAQCCGRAATPPLTSGASRDGYLYQQPALIVLRHRSMAHRFRADRARNAPSGIRMLASRDARSANPPSASSATTSTARGLESGTHPLRAIARTMQRVRNAVRAVGARRRIGDGSASASGVAWRAAANSVHR